ncbi:MAG: type 11 methyltransferase [Patescibacteria group bacterium]|nr:type 11 methyltransferase [Patescibacteria group bacterium]
MFSDPQKIIDSLPIEIGSSVADLGAGTGAWSILLAKKVGSTGKVYACEVQKDMLVRIENEAKQHNITNIQTVWSNVENHQGTKLRDASVDWAIAANVLFQVEDQPGFIKEISRILKPGGKCLLVDWKESFGNLGPHEKDVVSETEATEQFAIAGLRRTQSVIDGGSHHYAIIFAK